MDEISEDEFHDWGIHLTPDGDLLSFDAVKDHDLHQVWTIVEVDDGSWMAVAGFHVVNRVGYITTDRRWVDGSEVAVYAAALGMEDDEEDAL